MPCLTRKNQQRNPNAEPQMLASSATQSAGLPVTLADQRLFAASVLWLPLRLLQVEHCARARLRVSSRGGNAAGR